MSFFFSDFVFNDKVQKKIEFENKVGVEKKTKKNT